MNKLSIIGVLSILTSLGLAVMLIALATNNQNENKLPDSQLEILVEESTEENEVNDDVENIEICILEADEYFLMVKEELNQVDRLVSDAVNGLVINFRYISNLTKAHHDMVLLIERMAAPEGSKSIL